MRQFALAACAAVFCGISVPVFADVRFVSQSNIFAISFVQSDFSDARIDGADTLSSTATAAGEFREIFWSPGGSNRRVEFVGGVVVDGIIDNGGFSYNVRHPTGAPGSHTMFFTIAQPYGQAFFTSIVNGVPRLRFVVTSTPQVDPGVSFAWAATIPGDWSSLGTGPGQAELVSLNAGWTVTQNFVYDGSLTHFAFERQPGVANGPGAVMNFYGIPAPGGVSMLGMMAIGLCQRRRGA